MAFRGGNFDPYALDLDDEPPIVEAIPVSSSSPNVTNAFPMGSTVSHTTGTVHPPSYAEAEKMMDRDNPIYQKGKKQQATPINFSQPQFSQPQLNPLPQFSQTQMVGISGPMAPPPPTVVDLNRPYRSVGEPCCDCIGADSCCAPSKSPLTCTGPYDSRTKTYQSTGISRYAYRGVNACFAIFAVNAFCAVLAINSFFSFGCINSVFSLFCVNSVFSIGCMNSAFSICFVELPCPVNKYSRNRDKKCSGFCTSSKILTGKRYSSIDCEYCPAGYQPVNERSTTVEASCQICPAGTYSRLQPERCYPCQTGKTSGAGSSVCTDV